MRSVFGEHDSAGFADRSETLSLRDADGDVVIPDAHFLFNADFHRDGDDLVLSHEGQKIVVRDYFSADRLPDLQSPEGAALSGELVEILAGPANPGQYAQASAPVQSAQAAIGRVVSVSGSATAIRNGVAVTLNSGDVVLRADVIQTGVNSALSITLIDSTTFSMTANARMVVSELLYDPNGSANSALISLVQGTINFVAGKVAQTGDMRIDTPVATMGIRGTAVQVNINSTDGSVQFSVMIEPNGQTGSFNVFDRTTGALLATVNNSQIGYILTPVTPTQVNVIPFVKTPEQLQQELAIVQQVFQFQNLGEQILQQQQPNPTPQSSGAVGSEGTQNPNLQPTPPITSPQIDIQIPPPPPPPGPNDIINPDPFVNLPNPPPVIVVAGTSATASTAEAAGQTGSPAESSVNGNVTFTDIDPDQHSVGASFVSATWLRADGTSALIGDQGTLTITGVDAGAKSVTWNYAITDAAIDFLGEGETLTVTYVITIVDSLGQSASQTVTITVTGANDDPQIEAGSVVSGIIDAVPNPQAAQSAIGEIDFAGIDFTDSHAASALFQGAGSPLGLFTVALVQDTTGTGIGGQVQWTYTIDPQVLGSLAGDETRIEQFVVRIDDGQGGIAQQVVTITINGADDVPTAPTDSDDSENVVIEGALAGTLVGITALAFDLDGEIVTYALADDAGGRFTIDPVTGEVSVADASLIDFESAPGHAYEIVVAASDGNESSTPTFTIALGNVAPGAVADAYEIGKGGTLTIAANTGVLSNDSDVNGGTLAAVLDSGPSFGTLTLNPDGSFTYTPEAGFVGVDTFTYVASDGTDESAAVTASITVVAPNQAPVIFAPDRLDYWTASADGVVTAINRIAFADRDSDDDPVTVTLSIANGGGDLFAPDLAGDGVTVAIGADGSMVTLVGAIADINAYIAGNNILFDPPGDSLADRVVTVTIDDQGHNGSGGALTASADVTLHSVSFAFGDGVDVVELYNVNLYGIANVSTGGQFDLVVTSYSHLDTPFVTYDLGASAVDSIILVFSPEQVEEIFASAAWRGEMQGYLDGSGVSGDTLDLSETSWNAVVTGAESARLVIASGEGLSLYFAIADDLPDYIDGPTGNDADNTLVGTAVGETLLGETGNDILVGLAGDDILNGGAGFDLLLGGAGNDILDGCANNDILWGGAGRDTFKFTGDFGRDDVLDFQIGLDVIEIDQSMFANFADVIAHAVDVGDETNITDTNGNVIVIKNVSVALLQASDFQFV